MRFSSLSCLPQLPLLPLLLLVAAMLVPRTARASDPPTVDWGRLLVRANSEVPHVLEGMSPPSSPPGRGLSVERDESPPQPRLPELAPRLTFFARDWGRSHLLKGRLPASELFRLSRSSRMLLGRVTFFSGSITPYAQLGLGQWRVDTSVVAVSPHNTELAMQIGGGLDVRAFDVCDIVVEASTTFFYRDTPHPDDVPRAHVARGLVAAFMRF